MEKISLYDLLSILLPGSLLTLFIEMMSKDLNFGFENIELSYYFSLTVFLSSAIFLGSIINILTRKLLKFYKRIGLYKPLHKIYKQIHKDSEIISYYDSLMDKYPKKYSFEEKIIHIWDKIYYKLEANEKIAVPKTFQSFYFFFRNFFTLSLILLIPVIFMIIYKWFTLKYTIILIVIFVSAPLNIFAGNWNRTKMVVRMFWTYYSLYKK